jgi:hypothetical protein
MSANTWLLFGKFFIGFREVSEEVDCELSKVALSKLSSGPITPRLRRMSSRRMNMKARSSKGHALLRRFLDFSGRA